MTSPTIKAAAEPSREALLARLDDRALREPVEEVRELLSKAADFLRRLSAPVGAGVREALAEALSGLEYIAPAIPVLRTMFMTADLKLGAEKAAEMDASNKEAIAKLKAVLSALASPSSIPDAPGGRETIVRILANFDGNDFDSERMSPHDKGIYLKRADAILHALKPQDGGGSK
jgi:hypothetical protein